MYRHIGSRYTPAQVYRMMKRARRFAILREDKAVEQWLIQIRK
jgi:hypothetical protein